MLQHLRASTPMLFPFCSWLLCWFVGLISLSLFLSRATAPPKPCLIQAQALQNHGSIMLQPSRNHEQSRLDSMRRATRSTLLLCRENLAGGRRVSEDMLNEKASNHAANTIHARVDKGRGGGDVLYLGSRIEAPHGPKTAALCCAQVAAHGRGRTRPWLSRIARARAKATPPPTTIPKTMR